MYIYMNVCAPCVFLMHEEVRRRELDTMDLELWMVVSHYVGSENRTGVLYKSNKCSNY